MLETQIREICKLKGLRMSDLAERIGMTQSNLVASIRNNPKLSTLNDICQALGIQITELFENEYAPTSGMVILNGETYTISQPTLAQLQLPIYNDYTKMRHDLKTFIEENTKVMHCYENHDKNTMFGVLEGFELFNLLYDADSRIFHLSLCYQNQKTLSYMYDYEEYVDQDRNWDIEAVFKQIDSDIECNVLEKISEQ